MTERVKLLLVVWALLVATLWVGGSYVRVMLLTADEPRTVVPRGELAGFEQVATELFESTGPAVVYIFTETASRGLFGASAPNGGAGSGFVWDRAGHVVTNYHVVQGADRISVRLDSGEAVAATLVGAAPGYDLALLKLATTPTNLRPIPVGESASLKVGQAVFAIGNPFGLSRSLSTGVVSALNRHLPTATGREIHGVIQTDAAINPGNSGGPLLDSAGRLIGVNTAIVTGTGSSAGVGFAIPVDVVNRVVPQLVKEGKFPRPGIGIITVDERTSARLGLRGIVITEVLPGSSAAGAGLEGIDRRSGRLGDVITEVNGRRVQSLAEMAAALEQAGIGSEVTLTVIRNNRKRTVRLYVIDIS